MKRRRSPETFEARWTRGHTGPEVGATFKGHVKRNGVGPTYWSPCRVTVCEPERVFEFAVGTEAGLRRYFPVRHEEGGNMDPDQVFNYLFGLSPATFYSPDGVTPANFYSCPTNAAYPVISLHFNDGSCGPLSEFWNHRTHPPISAVSKRHNQNINFSFLHFLLRDLRWK